MGFTPTSLPHFNIFLVFWHGFCPHLEGGVLQYLLNTFFGRFPFLGHSGRIGSSTDLRPVSLPILTLVWLSETTFVSIFKEVCSDIEEMTYFLIPLFGHSGRIGSSLGFNPASLQILTLARLSRTAFAEIHKEVFSDIERRPYLAVSPWDTQDGSDHPWVSAWHQLPSSQFSWISMRHSPSFLRRGFSATTWSALLAFTLKWSGEKKSPTG